MRFAVEAWAPEYGAAADPVLEATAEEVDLSVEAPVADWGPRSPPPGVAAPAEVCFVDGVRRVDARVWVTTGTGPGPPRPGICASYAAGVVRCDGAAELTEASVGRRLFCPVVDAGPIDTPHGRWSPHPVPGEDPNALSLALQGAMADLEHQVSMAAGAVAAGGDGRLLVLDGPLRDRHRLPGAVGFVKTHHRSYLPDPGLAVVAALAPGQRTPVFLIGGRWSRWSWYLRLPTPPTHDWAGVVRCEASLDVAAPEAATLADRVALVLPRFASAAHKDSRAPQNLYPIGGLERDLRHRLGDPTLMLRALRSAAAPASAVSQESQREPATAAGSVPAR